MDFDEQFARLVERHLELTQTVESLAMQHPSRLERDEPSEPSERSSSEE